MPLSGLLNPDKVARIAVLRALELGDLLCSVPAFRALRAKFPRARITLIGLDWAGAFVERFNHYFDDFLELPGFPGLPERPFDAARFSAFLLEAQSRKFDVAIQMHGSGSFVNPLLAMLAARCNAGFYRTGEYCPDANTFLTYPEEGHEVFRHLRLMEFLGIEPQGHELEFPVTEADRAALAGTAAASGLQPRGYVCLHPGARYSSRRWPIERFAAVGAALAADGLEIVITGTKDELPLAHELSRRLTARHRVLAGETTLGTVAALLADSRLLISNDTGVSHIAAGLTAPSVIIVTGSDPQRWAPLDAKRHPIVRHQVTCQPCNHRICPIDHPCATGVSVETVMRLARSLIADTQVPAAHYESDRGELKEANVSCVDCAS